ncbi:hypothetical protein D918_08608 [Trichuris suis]|nr:hypothetical protein D918_08608 [Trichuris suis]
MRSSSVSGLFNASLNRDSQLLQGACEELNHLIPLTQALVEHQLKAAEKLLLWSVRENNRAIENVNNDCAELMHIWNDVHRVFSGLIEQAISELRQIRGEESMSRALRDAQKRVAQCIEKEAKLRKDRRRALKWLKGGSIRLLELRLEETSHERQAAEYYLDQVRAERKAVTMICYKKAMTRFSETCALIGKCSQIVFDTERELISQIPDVAGESVFEMEYTPSARASHTLATVKQRLEEIIASYDTMLSPKNISNHRGGPPPLPPPPYSP